MPRFAAERASSPANDYPLLPMNADRENVSEADASATAQRNQASDSRRWSGGCSIPWGYEIFTWLGSVCFFVAIAGFLYYLDRKPLPSLPNGLAPNAVINLLASVGVGLMMASVSASIGQLKWLRALRNGSMLDFRRIDDASRGPSGSLFLLLRNVGGSIASLGASITVLSLLISTFFQQAVKYQTRIYNNCSAAISVARTLNGSGSVQDGVNSQAYSHIDSTFISAPFIGLWSEPKTDFLPTVRCDTGNCTWNTFETLAICHTCKDLSESLNRTKKTVKQSKVDPWETDYYTLPNGFALKGTQKNTVDFTPIIDIMIIATSEGPQRQNSIWFADHGSKFLSVFVIGPAPGTLPALPDDTSLPANTQISEAPPVAFECLLEFCIREIEATFSSGTLTEAIISSWTNMSAPYLETNLVLTSQTTSQSFFVDYDTLWNTQIWLTSLLYGNTSRNIHIDGDGITISSMPLLQPIYTAMNNSIEGFPNLMENLANIMTSRMRDASYQGTPFCGVATSSTSFAVVTWQWLIFPLFELLASLALLVVVIIKTRRNGLVPWANNLLAYFFHGFDRRTPHSQAAPQTQLLMEDEARNLMMEFRPRGDGGHLVRITQ